MTDFLQVFAQIDSYLSQNITVQMNLADIPLEILTALKNHYITDGDGQTLYIGQLSVHKFQTQRRRNAVGNMFNTIMNAPPRADGKPHNLEDFLNPVVAATPVD